ncbi:MAG: isopentenyl phosphate kinase [Candidatus Paceibacterota bacterium]|jgi:isopentenyl phosphate kinase
MKTGNLVIIKLGGSVLTRKKQNKKKIERKNLKRLSGEIASAMKKDGFKLIVVHGVGSFGHVLSEKYSLAGGFRNKEQIGAISDIGCDLAKLDLEISEELRNCGVSTISLRPSSLFYSDSGKLKLQNLKIVSKVLELGFVPMLHGDIVFDAQKGFGILSGDSIILHLAKYFKPNRIILGTDVDGVFDCDPNLHKNAKLIRSVNSGNLENIDLSGSTAIDVTGGMKGKILELLKLPKSVSYSQIVNISKPGVLEKALLGNTHLGTIIKP